MQFTLGPMRAIRHEAGQAVVELALSLPIFVGILVGGLETSRSLLATVGMTSAILAGAQYGALSVTAAADTAGIASAVRAEAARIPGATPSNPSVTSSIGTDSDGRTYVTMSGTFNLTTLFQYPGLPQSYTITRLATLQVRRG